jgi:hypothetical protein
MNIYLEIIRAELARDALSERVLSLLSQYWNSFPKRGLDEEYSTSLEGSSAKGFLELL